MLCYYHDDLDGRCSAAIVGRAIRGARFVAADYRRPIPRHPVDAGETVVIVDYLPADDAMRWLRERAARLIWIDHHASSLAREEYADLEGRREEGRAACELTWEFFYPGKPLPRAVQLTGDRDVWTWRYGEETASFCEGIRLVAHHPEAPVWDALLEDCRPTLDAIVKDGHVCRRYQLAVATEFIEKYGFETTLDGYRCYAANLNLFGSEIFGRRYARYPVCMTFVNDGHRYHVTLYSQDTDVLPMAARRGGGGHRQAAGFSCRDLPFKMVD